MAIARRDGKCWHWRLARGWMAFQTLSRLPRCDQTPTLRRNPVSTASLVLFLNVLRGSSEQALLSIVLWSDVPTRHGGTYIAPESVGHIARYLAQHPEGCGGWDGASPPMPNAKEIIAKCSRFVEITGETGDVVLHHPFMLHTSSPNPSGVPRFITNPVSVLKEPMNFNRADCSYSPVDSASVRHLGCTAFDVAPLTERAGRPAPPITVAGPEEELRVFTQLQALQLDWASAGMRRRQPRSYQLGAPRVWTSTDDVGQCERSTTCHSSL